MKERPILFSGELVRAILDGRKTQTRRPVRLRAGQEIEHGAVFSASDPFSMVTSPFGAPGDRLYVREAHRFTSGAEDAPLQTVRYRADGDDESGRPWRPSIHMPRWASRIDLEVTGVRVERLRSMSFEDWRRDFAPNHAEEERARASFTGAAYQAEHARERWDAIYADADPEKALGWTANPWVWVVEFRVAEVRR